jgi:hypothetical protein
MVANPTLIDWFPDLTSSPLPIWQQELQAAAERLESTSNLSSYADDPAGFFRDVLKINHLTSEQIQIAESVRDNPETNVQAAHGVGKSFIASSIVIWHVFCVQGLAITTAPTESQVKEILWSEIRKLYDAHKRQLGGERSILSLKLTETARAYGFTSRDYDSNSFQGKHAEKLLLIQDEACGITAEIDDGFQSCLTGAQNRGLRIGNPIQSATPFHLACKRSHIRVPVWTHPNVAWAYRLEEDGVYRLKPEVAAQILNSEGDVLPQSAWPPELPRDVIPGAVSISWIEGVRKKKGEGSTFWQSRVDGLFPLDSEESIIPRSWWQAARRRYDENPRHWDGEAGGQDYRFGLDVGDGEDAHAIAGWRGPVLYLVQEHPTRGDREDVGRAATLAGRLLTEYGGSVKVDRIGVGAGALSNLIEGSYDAHGVHWGEGVNKEVLEEDDPPFLNRKAQDFWQLREAFRLGEVAIAPLGEYEEQAMEELAGTYYEETAAGKTRIEDKKKTRKRLGRSPNLGDAIVLAHARPAQDTWLDDILGL